MSGATDCPGDPHELTLEAMSAVRPASSLACTFLAGDLPSALPGEASDSGITSSCSKPRLSSIVSTRASPILILHSLAARVTKPIAVDFSNEVDEPPRGKQNGGLIHGSQR